jgi:hypothetical protein
VSNSNFAPKRTSYDAGDTRWNRSGIKADTHGVTVTTSSFASGHIAADGLVKSGTAHADPKNGLLLNDLVIKAGEKHLVAFVNGGQVDRRYLPRQLNQAGEAAIKNVTFINGTAPAS